LKINRCWSKIDQKQELLIIQRAEAKKNMGGKGSFSIMEEIGDKGKQGNGTIKRVKFSVRDCGKHYKV